VLKEITPIILHCHKPVQQTTITLKNKSVLSKTIEMQLNRDANHNLLKRVWVILRYLLCETINVCQTAAILILAVTDL